MKFSAAILVAIATMATPVNAGVSVREQGSCFSKEVQPGFEVKDYYFGHDKPQDGPNGSGEMFECEKLCLEDTRCKAYSTFNSGNTCYLSQSPELVPAWNNPGIKRGKTINKENCRDYFCMSREAPGYEVKDYYLGHDKTYNGVNGYQKFHQCEQMCIEDPICNSYSTDNSGGSCYLSTSYELKPAIKYAESKRGKTYNKKNCDSGGGPGSFGDPHIKTWSGEQYDYHGACDLVLLQNPNFANGMGMNIHVRTSTRSWWSYIESAVVALGEHTLEVKASLGEAGYWINGGEEKTLENGEASLGDFPVQFKRVNNHHTSARIDLGKGDAIGIETFKDFVRVNIKNKSEKQFPGSLGLIGSYPDGAKIGRDGKTVFTNNNEFGQEWQVLASEPKLFHTVEGYVQHPQKCVMPDDTKKSAKRRLGEASLTEEDAALVCALVKEAERDACISDVLATQDKDMAGSY